MHTVFVNNRPFRFVDIYEAEDWKGNTDCIFLAEGGMSIEEAIQELEDSKRHPGFILLTANPDVMWQLFTTNCTLIEASGGLVTNELNEYLIIFRKGKYDLPKGKLEYDESPEDGGMREVKEECGIKSLEIIRPLEKTFHTYKKKKVRMLKKTHWFLMKTTDRKLVPQIEEDIERAEWMTRSQINDNVLQHAYASVEELLLDTLEL